MSRRRNGEGGWIVEPGANCRSGSLGLVTRDIHDSIDHQRPVEVRLVMVSQAEHSAQAAVNVVEKSTGDLPNFLAQAGLVERGQRRDIHHGITR